MRGAMYPSCVIPAVVLIPMLVWGVLDEPLADATQLLVVTTHEWDAVDGSLQRFERTSPKAAWTPVGSPVTVVVGRKGLAWGRGIASDARTGDPLKKEGDGRAPAGVFRLGPMFGQSRDRLAGASMPYLFLDDNVECVDDARSAHYNQLLSQQKAGGADWASSEKMWTEPLYKWGVVVAHNNPQVQPGGGSCIFLHIWKAAGAGTAGCTAMPEQDLVEILRWLRPSNRPLLVQLPRPEYERLKSAWKLP